jgi:hypothetical protein
MDRPVIDQVVCANCGNRLFTSTQPDTMIIYTGDVPRFEWHLTLFDRIMMIGYGIAPDVLDEGYWPQTKQR